MRLTHNVTIHHYIDAHPPSTTIERLHLISPAIKQPKHPLLHSVSFIRLHSKRVVISTVILETQVLLCQLSL